MVEALGTAPKSSMCVESYQRLRLIYNTSFHVRPHQDNTGSA